MTANNKADLQLMVDRIRSVMKDRGITAATLTKDLEISSTSLTDWKSSNPPAWVIGRVAEKLRVSTDYIISGKSSPDFLEDDEQSLLSLYRRLPESTKRDFIGWMRLYTELREL